MLNEIAHLRQSNRCHLKRWFTSRDMDLFIWLRKGMPVRFQLAYNKRSSEKAITWSNHLGFRHYLVDSGETMPDKYKQTPLLLNISGLQNFSSVARDFLAASNNMEIGLSDFIFARLVEYLSVEKQRGATHTAATQPALQPRLKSAPETGLSAQTMAMVGAGNQTRTSLRIVPARAFLPLRHHNHRKPAE